MKDEVKAEKPQTSKTTKAQKRAALVKKAKEVDEAKAKKEAQLKERGEDPYASVEKPLTKYALKKLVIGKTYSFKCNHGRVKFHGDLYEMGTSFLAELDDQLKELCAQGILIPS